MIISAADSHTSLLVAQNNAATLVESAPDSSHGALVNTAVAISVAHFDDVDKG